MFNSEPLIKHFDGRVNEIKTEVAVRALESDDEEGFHSYDAIWDTGAMTSCISPKIASEMKLQQFDVVSVRGVGDAPAVRKPVYLVDIKLSNGMVIKGVKMVGVEVAGSEILIGMNVISQGNFSIFYDEQGDMNMSFALVKK